MKKLLAVVLALCLMSGAALAEASPRILIAYVSRAGENYNVGVTDPDSASAAYAGYVEKGNTEIVAETIAELTGGDLYHIMKRSDAVRTSLCARAMSKTFHRVWHRPSPHRGSSRYC